LNQIAILIDGGFFLKRIPTVCPSVNSRDPKAVCNAISRLVTTHLRAENKITRAAHPRSLLYRVFYYDAKPYTGKTQLPISNKALDYAKTDEAVFRTALFNELRSRANTAVRLGEVRKERNWVLNEPAQKKLLNTKIEVSDLTDSDFSPGLRQKAVDMRIGLDIASITLKKQASKIILVSGDADFVPAAKLARREGVKITLDPLWQNPSADLNEHIDQLRNGTYRPIKTKV